MKLIGTYLREANKPNDKAIFYELYCEIDGNCPLLREGKCIHAAVTVGLFGLSRCVYGTCATSCSKSKKTKSYFNFVKEARDKIAESPSMPSWTGCDTIAELGDYIYFPYNCASMCEQVPFLAHFGFMAVGKPFILKSNFTADTIITLASFRPRAIMTCEVLTDYQKKVVPIFLFHLKAVMPKLYEEAAIKEPSIVTKTFDPSALKTLVVPLGKIPANVTNGYTIKNQKILAWDGETLEIEADGPIFMYGKDFVIRYKADKKKTLVTITDSTLIKEVLEKDALLLPVER